MSADILLIIMGVITITCIFFAIVYTSGIVWRVELELDSSYKFFMLAALCLFASEVLAIYYSQESRIANELAAKALKMLFSVFFLSGVYLMRDIVRKLNGEKTSKEQEAEEILRKERERDMKEMRQ